MSAAPPTGHLTDGWEHLRAQRRRAALVLAALAMLLGVLSVASLVVGTVALSPGEVLGILVGRGEAGMARQVVWAIRLPRMAAAALLGGALGVAGLLLQTLFANPIAGPYVLGISSGAKLAVALVMVTIVGEAGRLSSWMSVGAAFAGSLAAMAVVLTVSRRAPASSTLVIVGVMIGYVCNALTDVVVNFASDASVASLRGWSLGSFSGIRADQLPWVAALVLGSCATVALLAKPMAAYQLGEAYAESLGVDVRGFRRRAIAVSSLLSATVAAFAGPVSFVGVAAPHVARRLLGTARPLVVAPASFLLGAVVCLASDLVARTLFAPQELSVSTVTAVFGAPVVLWVLLGRRRPAAGGM